MCERAYAGNMAGFGHSTVHTILICVCACARTPLQAQQALERDRHQEADMESEELLLTRGPGAR